MRLRSKKNVFEKVDSIQDFDYYVRDLLERFDLEYVENVEDRFLLNFVNTYYEYYPQYDDYEYTIRMLDDGDLSDEELEIVDIVALKNLISRMKTDYREYKRKFDDFVADGGWDVAWYWLTITREVTLDVRYGGRFDEIELGGEFNVAVYEEGFEKMLNDFYGKIQELISFVDIFEKELANAWRRI